MLAPAPGWEGPGEGRGRSRKRDNDTFTLLTENHNQMGEQGQLEGKEGNGQYRQEMKGGLLRKPAYTYCVHNFLWPFNLFCQVLFLPIYSYCFGHVHCHDARNGVFGLKFLSVTLHIVEVLWKK